MARAAFGTDVVCYVFCLVGTGSIVDSDVGTLFRKDLRDPTSDAAACHGDEGYFSFESHRG